jgi:hypothetical protein
MATRQKYKSIGLKECDYLALAEKKRQVESIIGKRVDWPEFLLLMAGLWEDKGMTAEHEVANLAQGEPSDEKFDSFFLPSTPQVEAIVAKHADRVIRELRKLLEQQRRGSAASGVPGKPDHKRRRPS